MRADYTNMSRRQHTFLSSFVSGICMIIITLIICVTVVTVYGMSLFSKDSTKYISLAEGSLQELPAVIKALPLASDILNSEREPEYCELIEIAAEPVLQNSGRLGLSLTISNNGSKVVSLMSLRLVILDSNKKVLSEMNKWVVTPVAGDNDWPGPLMPDSKRYFSIQGKNAYNIPDINELKVEVEVTEIRIWNEEQPAPIMDVNMPTDIAME